MRRWRIFFIVRRASIRRTCIEYGRKNATSLDFLRETCRNSKHRRTSSEVVNALIARLARLEGLRNALRQRFEHVDSCRIAKREFLWLEIETAFNNRVLTGVVLNSSYIEPRQFLDNAIEIPFSIGYAIIFRDIFV